MRRGQAALEFLMTYGWAILVVLVIIGALGYFGVLNPSNLVPEKCTMQTGLTCQDYKLEPDQTKFVFQNALGKQIEIVNASVRGIDDNGYCYNSSINKKINNGEEAAMTLGTCDTELTDTGRKYRADVEVVYHYTGTTGNFNHTSTGEILANME